MVESSDNPKNTSSDYDSQVGYWTMVNAILCGAEALRAPAAMGQRNVGGPAQPYAHLSQLSKAKTFASESPYLPRFENETPADYERRRSQANLTNIYADLSRFLASKPFSKETQLEEGAAEDLKTLAENIDGQGHSLHVYARELFKEALDKGICWTLVDYTNVPAGVTLADEQAMGARPYWVLLPPERVLAVYSKFINGQEIIVHARIYEPQCVQKGYGEQEIERVRVLNRKPVIDATGRIIGYGPATWALYELIESKGQAGKTQSEWMLIEQGVFSVGFIPLVPFLTGPRKGISWRVEPPLRDLAYMQIKLFQQESNLDSIKEKTAFPMVAGNGVQPPTDADGGQLIVPIGPNAVLFAPPNADGSHGEWTFISPQADALNFLKADNERLATEMRDLGMQPLSVANQTVVNTANMSIKAHSAAQAWALGLIDALEQMWVYTATWLGRPDEEIVVNVHTDFGVDMQAQSELDALLKAEGQSILSKRTVQDEFKRRGVLSDDFDPEEEDQRLAEQQQGLQGEEMIDPRTGQPLRIDPATGMPMGPDGQSAQLQ